MIDQLCVQNFEITEKLKIEALEMSNILENISKKTVKFFTEKLSTIGKTIFRLNLQ